MATYAAKGDRFIADTISGSAIKDGTLSDAKLAAGSGGTSSIIKLAKVTFDFEDFDLTAANTTQQNIDLSDTSGIVWTVPDGATVVGVKLQCTSASISGTSTARNMTFNVGVGSAGNQYIAATRADVTTDLVLGSMVFGSAVWVGATPGANWNTPLTGGAWTMHIYYID